MVFRRRSTPKAGTWTLADVALTPGNKTLTVIATDTAGTQTTVTRTIIRDNQLPIMTITSPADNAITTEAAMTVTGTATDPGTGASGVDLVTVNGVQALFNHDSTFGTTATITGKAYDEGDVPSGIVEIKVNGQLVTYDAATRTWTFTQLPLVLGGNLIQAEPATEWAM